MVAVPEKSFQSDFRKGGPLIENYFPFGVVMLPIFWIQFGGEK
jgi:hypothetical protein